MKLHEALNLYKLHADPSKLNNHQNAARLLQTRSTWASFWCIDGAEIVIDGGTDQIQTVFERYFLANYPEVAVLPFSEQQMREKFNKIRPQYDTHEGRDKKNFDAKLVQFISEQFAAVQNPKTIVFVESESEECVAIFDTPLQAVQTVMGILRDPVDRD